MSPSSSSSWRWCWRRGGGAAGAGAVIGGGGFVQQFVGCDAPPRVFVSSRGLNSSNAWPAAATCAAGKGATPFVIIRPNCCTANNGTSAGVLALVRRRWYSKPQAVCTDEAGVLYPNPRMVARVIRVMGTEIMLLTAYFAHSV